MTTVTARITGNEAWLGRYDDAVAPVLPAYFDVVAERGEGSWLSDVNGPVRNRT